jgi:hypothetical protein
VKLTVTLVLFQPLALAAGARLLVITGLVSSMLMLVTLAVLALLPAASLQLPLMDWPEPSLVTVTSRGLLAELPVAAPVAAIEVTPEVLSVQVNSTLTLVLFQPFALAGVRLVAARTGATVSILTATGIVVDPVNAPALPALSVAWHEMLCVPSPATLSEPLATCVPIPLGLPTASAFTPSVQLIAVTLLFPVVVSSAVTVPRTGECRYQPFCPSTALHVIVTTGGLVSGLNTVIAAPVVVLLFACTLSVAAKLALIVWTANGVVGVTLIWQLTVPTGFAPWVNVQALMPSVLDGLLLEVTATVPAGFDLVPEPVSFTVIVNVAAVPAGVLAVSGLMLVDVTLAVTVSVWVPLVLEV